MLRSASSLFADLEVDVTHDAPLATLTWYGIGGKADLLIRPRTVDALATLVKRCRREGTAVRLLGEGANLLVADEGVDGVVIRLDHEHFREMRYNRQGEIQLMRCMAGADLARALMDSTRRGLDGLSQLAGIPASVGGATRMNAGGAYGALGEAVDAVTCVTHAGEVVTYAASELKFDYRATNIPDPVILATTFRLEQSDPVKLRDRVKEIFAFKKSTQPLAEHSAGCTFKNPIDPETEQRVSAGKLIDLAGLKGECVGGATVSRHHANFITTVPGATASHVLTLLETIRRRVYESAGIELTPEVVIWRRGEEAISLPS
jgi:UDP-N-acetylmuramate dehydrogenase